MSQAEVLNPDKTPARGIEVVFEPGQEKGLTAANGIVRVTVDTLQNGQPLEIKVGLCIDFHLDATVENTISGLLDTSGQFKQTFDTVVLKLVCWTEGKDQCSEYIKWKTSNSYDDGAPTNKQKQQLHPHRWGESQDYVIRPCVIAVLL